MSEAKEKAEALVEMFQTETPPRMSCMPKEAAIQCARLHVNQILNSDPNNDYIEYDFNKHKLGVDTEYWEEVLTELNKM